MPSSERGAAHFPDERAFAANGELARDMILRELASSLPIAWVTVGSAYGQDAQFRRSSEDAAITGIVSPRSYDHRMSDAFTVLWTHDTCRALRRAGRVGERPPVAYSGIHQSLPTWSGARAGDEVYALHVNRCEVFVVSRMRVIDRERGDCCGTAPATWHDPHFPGHDDWSMLGAGGCGATAVHVDATPVRFDTPIPGDLLPTLTWRNNRGKTRNLKFVENGRLERSVSLQGFYRLAPESAEALAGLVASTH